MGYKILGFVVWQVGRLYVRRRFSGAKRTAAIAGVSLGVAAAGAGVAAAGRRSKES